MRNQDYAPTLLPFEAMLEALHEAIVAADAGRDTELREQIEADLSARERALGLS